jgi:DNA-binding transcriptional regulator YdaS (Cro superfamily)
VGGGHADGELGYSAAAEHYDNVGTAVATVTAGEDEHGIWVAGALLADATETQIEALRQSPLSGDWRRIGGNLELVAAHAVNVPGFPVPRARAVVASGDQLSLVAAGSVKRPPVRQPVVSAREVAAEVMRSIMAAGMLKPAEVVPAVDLETGEPTKVEVTVPQVERQRARARLALATKGR